GGRPSGGTPTTTGSTPPSPRSRPGCPPCSPSSLVTGWFPASPRQEPGRVSQANLRGPTRGDRGFRALHPGSRPDGRLGADIPVDELSPRVSIPTVLYRLSNTEECIVKDLVDTTE